MIENTFPFVKELSEEDRAMLVGSMVTKNFPKGSIVNRNEDGCVGVLSVTAGRLRVYIVSDEGREITLFRVDPGEICVLSVSCLLDSIAFDVVIEAARQSQSKSTYSILYIDITTFCDRLQAILTRKEKFIRFVDQTA